MPSAKSIDSMSEPVSPFNSRHAARTKFVLPLGPGVIETVLTAIDYTGGQVSVSM